MGFKKGVYLVVSFFAMIFVSFTAFEYIQSMPCLIGRSNILKQLLKKPMDCSICVDATHIDEVEYINQDDFEDRYAYTGRPLVVRGAAINWPALSSFDFEFFKDLNNVSYMSSCQFLTYNDEFQDLDDVLQMDSERVLSMDETRPWYCGWSVCDPFAVQILRQYYQKPSFLPVNSENYIVDWIFMGSKGYGAKLHIDDVGLPSWQAQIKGIKRWTLKPPTECLYLCQDSFHADVFPGDIRIYARRAPNNAVVGSILHLRSHLVVLDTDLWYHATEVISTDISITIGAEYD